MVDLHRQLGDTIRGLAARLKPIGDAELLRRIRETRDEAAFAEIVDRHGPLVLGVCRRVLGRRGDAEDVFQAVFLTLARKVASIRQPEYLSTWLYRVAWNIANKARSKLRPSAPIADVSESSDPYARVEWAEIRGLLDEELNRLPDRVRAAMVLCYIEGVTRDRAAEQLKVSRRTLLRDLDEGRELLKERLGRRGVLAIPLALTVLEGTTLRASVPNTLVDRTAFLLRDSALPKAIAGLMPVASAWSAVAKLALVLSAIGIGTGLYLGTGPGEPKDSPTQAKSTPVVEQANIDGPLPVGALQRFGTRAYRNGEGIWFGNVSADGRWAVTASTGVHLWDLRDGSRRWICDTANNTVPRPTISPDGKTIVNLDGWLGIRIYDAATLKETHWLERERKIDLVQFTADSKKLICESAEVRWPKGIAGGSIHSAQSVNPKMVTLDLANGKTINEWPSPDQARWQSLVNSRNNIIGLATAGKNASLIEFDPTTGKTVVEHPLPDLWLNDGRGFGELFTSTWSLDPAGNVAAYLDSKYNIVVYELAKKQKRHAFKMPPIPGREGDNTPSRVRFSADGRTLFAVDSMGGTVRCDLTTYELTSLCPPFTPENSSVLFATDDASKVLITGGGEGEIVRRDAKTGKAIPNEGYHKDLRAGLSPDGRWLILNEDFGKAEIREAATGRLVKRYDRHAATVELANDAPRPKSDDPDAHVAYPRNNFALSPDGKLLVLARGSKVIVWDLANERELRTLPNEGFRIANASYGITNMFFSPDSKRVLMAATFGRLRMLDVTSGERIWESEDHKAGTNNFDRWAGFAADGRSVVRTNYFWEGQTVRLSLIRQDATTGAILQTHVFYDGPTGKATDVAIARLSPDGRIIAVALRDGQLHLFDAHSFKAIGEWKAKFEGTWALAFAPNGLTIARVDAKGVLRVADTFSGQEIFNRPAHSTYGNSLQFSRDGRRIVSAAGDGLAYIWDARVDVPLPETWWADLKGDDAAKAYRIVWALAKQADGVDKLKKAVIELPELPVLNVAALIGELDDPKFAVRERATKALTDAGRRAERALTKALDAGPSPETKARIEKVLAGRIVVPTADERRLIRAIAALEAIGTPEAKEVLKEWSMAAKLSWLAGEAEASLGRMP